MSATIITLADRRPTPVRARLDRLPEPAQIIALPSVPAAGAGNAAAAVAALRVACRDLAANLATIRQHVQVVRDSMDQVRDGARSVASGSGSIFHALRGAALRPGLVEEGCRG